MEDREIRAFKVGDKVKHPSTGEVGIVVHRYYEPDIQMMDLYIAFFGLEFPQGKPKRLPYILRYAEEGMLAAQD